MAGFAQARVPLVKGFMVGRSVWSDASQEWLRGDIDDIDFKARVKANFLRLVDGWRASRVAASVTEEVMP